MATLEHHPGLHIPKKIALAGAVALTAVAGFFGVRTISELSPQQLRSVPSASDQLPPQDIPIAISDPPKIIPQTPESQAPALEPPKLSPLEQAIRTGRIELSGPNDWEKYFTPVTKEAARELLEQTNSRGEFRWLLPFDPRGSNVTLENYTYTSQVNPEVKFVFLAVKSLLAGKTIYNPLLAGKASIGQSGNRDASGNFVPSEFSPRVSDEFMQISFRVPLDMQKASPFAEQRVLRQLDSNFGAPLFYTGDNHIEANNQHYKLVLTIALGPGIENLQLGGILYFSGGIEDLKKMRISGADMGNLLTLDGKVVFIAEGLK